ncbi:pyridoxamine 5'-phosphate oxidase family protein [Specibacter sp. NPDC078692]|uniref:pyridoxamine 5'-phosphate oxidase family protein n=1 Tax=Specibacter sp. NPDC078692 TaxID=3155818 RepID=UPI00342D0EEB
MRDDKVAPKAESLTTQQCWKLLSDTSVGRLAVIVGGKPDVFPVNYKIDGESLLFRTGPGTKVDAINDDASVALEADAVSAEFGLAWSIVVKGSAESVPADGSELNAAVRGLFPWQGVGKSHLIRIVPDTVTGRRFTMDASMTWNLPLNDAVRAGLE